jgi:hypothetical protein
MPERNYRVYLDDENSLFVYVETERKIVIAFVVKLLSVIDGKEVEILRFDSAHEHPHIDVLAPDGSTREKIWLPHLDNNRALTQAKKEIKQHYQFYRERYLQWLRNEKD